MPTEATGLAEHLVELDLAALEVDDSEAGRVAAVQGAGVDEEERGTVVMA